MANIVVVYRNKIPNLYVNGQFVKSGVADPNRDVHPPIRGGEYAANSGVGSGFFGDYFEGKIDDIAIWNRSLTDDEVAGIFSAGGF